MDIFEKAKAKRIYEEIGRETKKNLKKNCFLRFLSYVICSILILAFGLYFKSLNFHNSATVLYVALGISILLFLSILYNVIKTYITDNKKDDQKLGEENAKKSLLIKGNAVTLRKQKGTNSIAIGALALIVGLFIFFTISKSESVLDPSSLSQQQTSTIKYVESGDSREEAIKIFLDDKPYVLVLKHPYSALFNPSQLETDLKEEKEITYQYIEDSNETRKTLVTFKTDKVSLTLDEAIDVSKKYLQLDYVISGGIISIAALLMIYGASYYFYNKTVLESKAKYDPKDLEESDDSPSTNSLQDSSIFKEKTFNYHFTMGHSQYYKGFSLILFVISISGIIIWSWNASVDSGKILGGSNIALMISFIILFFISILLTVDAFAVKAKIENDKLTIVNLFSHKNNGANIINLSTIKSAEIKKTFKLLPFGTTVLYDENKKVLGKIPLTLDNQERLFELLKDLDVNIKK